MRFALKIDPHSGDVSVEVVGGATISARSAAQHRGKTAAEIVKGFEKIADAFAKLFQERTLRGKDALVPGVTLGFMLNFGQGHSGLTTVNLALPIMFQVQVIHRGMLINFMADEDFLLDNAETLCSGDFRVEDLVGKIGVSVGVASAAAKSDLTAFQEYRLLSFKLGNVGRALDWLLR